MKILLVGFSDKNAAVFKLFCERNFNDIICRSVERQFGDRLRLVLPTDIPYPDTNAYIIDLYGVGMPTYSEKNSDALCDFIGSKPTVLIKRTDDKAWLNFTNSVNLKVSYMTSPYSTEEAVIALKQLRSDFNRRSKPMINNSSSHTLADTIKQRKQALQAKMQNKNLQSSRVATPIDSIETSSVKTKNASTTGNAFRTSSLETNKVTTQISSDKAKVYNAMLQSTQANAIDDILKKYFNKAYNTMLTRTILSIFIYSEPLEVMVGNYRLLVNPHEQSVLLNQDAHRIIDYLSILGKQQHNLETKSIDMTILPSNTYNKLSEAMLAEGAKKYTYMTILWQIAEEVIPLNEAVGHYPLTIKVRYIPNFSVMRFVPSYVPSVISACLIKPRTIKELQQLFPDLSYHQLNRTLLICILSGIVDINSLLDGNQETSTYNTNKMISGTPNTQSIENKDISTAKRTGFFKRLLQKLAS